jgi:hypothetical protein
MFVRVLTLTGIDPDKIDEFGETARQATRPTLQRLEGYRGAVQMIDREGRRLRNAVFFESEDNLRAAEPTFESMPGQLPEELRDLVRQAERTIDVLEVLDMDQVSFG